MTRIFFFIIILALVLTQSSVLVPTPNAGAQEGSPPPSLIKEKLETKIREKNNEIAALEAEISVFKTEILKTTGQAKTLQGELNSLELTRKKLTADLAVTAAKIEAANLSIESLGSQIVDKEGAIFIQQEGLRSSLKDSLEIDNISLVEVFLDQGSLADVWSSQNTLLQLRESIKEKTESLQLIKSDLTNTKVATEKKQRELLFLKNQLADQRKIVESNKKQTDLLLKETKNKESNYKKLLGEREAKRLAFEKELLAFESELKLIIDPDSFPNPNKILSNPLDGLTVTQQFGDTTFSRQNPGAYSGKGHNGVDFKASPGSKVYTALSGVVQGVGDTDIVCPGASYGRWVLIKHANGLTSLYAHLSLIKASEGQSVVTGELIGYSGNTGFSTGPHLHFGLYVSQGVQISTLKSKVCGGTYRLPVADLRAYLNPMLYL